MELQNDADCPNCDYPLTEKGFCAKCGETPRFPPPTFRHAEPSVGIGAGHLPQNLSIRRRYELPALRSQGYVPQEELVAWLAENASTAVAPAVGTLLELLLGSP